MFESIGGSFLFMIDEAELHLHPSAQRSLKNALMGISSTDQVLVNTHSSVLIVEDHPNQGIFRVEKLQGVTSIEAIDPVEKTNIIFDLLGGNPLDLLFPNNFLIVEGRSEFIFLTDIISVCIQMSLTGSRYYFRGEI